MDVNSVGRPGFAPLPTFKDMAAVMAARPSMAQMSSQVAVRVSNQADSATEATRSASSVVNGSVDMYL